MTAIFNASCANAQTAPDTSAGEKALVVYYSYTGNCTEIVETLLSQINADAVEIQPAQEGLDYNADNYRLGSEQIEAILANPGSADSYPEIKPVNVSLAAYSSVIIVTPLWHNHMASPMQSYLFQNGMKMAGKNIGLIVSSWSSGITQTEADARRLVPEGKFFNKPLWINHTGQSKRTELISEWLKDIDYSAIASIADIHMDTNDGDGRIFDLKGRKLAQTPERGIYITNGKKYIR